MQAVIQSSKGSKFKLVVMNSSLHFCNEMSLTNYFQDQALDIVGIYCTRQQEYKKNLSLHNCSGFQRISSIKHMRGQSDSLQQHSVAKYSRRFNKTTSTVTLRSKDMISIHYKRLQIIHTMLQLYKNLNYL
ncbi:unnamed protein product [Paramecium octaurelia]|uniref:Uncharacterized protein n=1 Tax=Paramecium octaurelia TaxID=43137 RepID=A0A8S1YJ91_PAROT|nr:unnamed protein product [Paramecium octaurelia]